MHCVRLFLISVFLFIPLNTFALEVNEYKLENGLTVLIVEEHKAPVATFQVWYRAGSRYEPYGKSGLGHLLEHMMFKGTSRYSQKLFSRIVQNNGGTDNAYTTEDYTVYFQTFPSDRVILSVDLEADRMQNLILDPKEIFLEKNVVIEERRLEYEDNPQNSLFEEVVAASFKAHPYQRPVIGWISDLKSIRRDDLYDYYKAYYSPENAFIVVAGDIKADEMIGKIRSSFRNIPTGYPKKTSSFSEPEQRSEIRVLLRREAELPYILIAYHTPSFPDEDCYALEVLDMILSGGKSSRLYKSLVYEKNIALDAGSDYIGYNRDPYLFFIDATVSPGNDIKEVEDSIYAEIEKITKEPPTEREIQKAKNQIESSFIMGQDSIDTLAERYGMFEILGGWRLTDKYLECIRKVKPEDVLRAAKKYLKKDNRTVGILIPTTGE